MLDKNIPRTEVWLPEHSAVTPPVQTGECSQPSINACTAQHDLCLPTNLKRLSVKGDCVIPTTDRISEQYTVPVLLTSIFSKIPWSFASWAFETKMERKHGERVKRATQIRGLFSNITMHRSCTLRGGHPRYSNQSCYHHVGEFVTINPDIRCGVLTSRLLRVSCGHRMSLTTEPSFSRSVLAYGGAFLAAPFPEFPSPCAYPRSRPAQLTL